MSLIAEITLFSPLMVETSRAIPEMQFEMEDLQLVEDGPAKYVFWAQGGPFERLEAALAADPTVDSFSRLTDLPERHLYRVSFTDEAKTQVTYLDASAFDIVYLDLTTRDARTRIRARVPDRDALHAFLDACRAKEIDVHIDSLYREDTATHEPRFGLTDPQHEALVRAYEAGYFESDRLVTLADVAADLGISRQALAGRLRRGHNQLIAATLL